MPLKTMYINSNYCDINQFENLKFSEKKSLSLLHINAYSLIKNFDDFQHLLKCANKILSKIFDKAAVSETRTMKNSSLTSNIN